MKNILFFIILFLVTSRGGSQTSTVNRIVENEKGKVITNDEEKELFLSKLEGNKEREIKQLSLATVSQTSVEMCTNSGFEQYETISGSLKLKNFLYTIGDPPGPTECKSITISMTFGKLIFRKRAYYKYKNI